MAVLNLMIDKAPTKPKDNANDDFTTEIIKAVVVAIKIKFLLKTFLPLRRQYG